MTIKSARTKRIGKDSKLFKYWNQRYNLFSRFDDGVLLDEESWYSVTPENIAQHIAKRVHNFIGDEYPLIVDAFCGVGGNLIQFAQVSPYVRVLGCDINQDRINMAKNNAKIYGVANRCEFILGDFMEIVRTLKSRRVDAVFLSPPWGGVGYKDKENYSLSSMAPNGFEVVHLCRKYLTDNIAFLMPRNIDIKEVRKKLLDKNHPLFEIEENKIGNKIKTITAYFGDLVDESSETDSEL